MDLLDKFLAQMAVVQAAWIPFLVAVAVVGLGIWKAMGWRYSGLIDTLEHRLKLKDDTIAHFERNGPEHVGQPLPVMFGSNVHNVSLSANPSDDIALATLSNIYEGRTPIQADKLAAPYIGSRVKVSGSVAIVTALTDVETTLTLDNGRKC